MAEEAKGRGSRHPVEVDEMPGVPVLAGRLEFANEGVGTQDARLLAAGEQADHAGGGQGLGLEFGCRVATAATPEALSFAPGTSTPRPRRSGAAETLAM